MLKFSPIDIKIWSKLGSCGALGAAAIELAEKDDKVVFLTADLRNYSGLDRYAKKFPERFINVGIAEENLINIGAGMAKKGFKPFCTTYATFASMRCADQVRVSMGYMGANIKLVGLTAGFSVGILGATHVSVEDLAVMRAIPNITILSPADSLETIKCLLASNEIEGPCYIRLTGTFNNPIVYSADYNYVIGKANKLFDGDDIGIIATGTMVYQATEVAKRLDQLGIKSTLYDMHTIKPLDTAAIESLKNKKMIFTIEEHSIFSGLGAAIAEYVAQRGGFPQMDIIGIKDEFPHAASYEYLLDKYGLSIDKIYQRILLKIKENNL